MKKCVLGLALGVLCLLPLAACGTAKAEIVMIPDAAGVNDGSFNQSAWEGIRLFAGVNGKSCNYYQPTRQEDKAFLASIKKGVHNGAEVVVLPGQAFGFIVGQAQVDYPDTSFIMLDALPVDGPAENTVAIRFAEEQAGYLAGYAAVADGYRALGFLGGAPVPGVTGYGFGFVQGAADAAVALDAAVQLRYAYNGQFVENEEARALAESWYAEGTELIFTCGGAMNRSVFDAAEAAGGKTIGVDSDQAQESPTVLTSAVKALGTAAGQTLEQYYSGQFPGGQTLVLGAAEGAVGLAIENSRFAHFTKQDYDALLSRLRQGGVEILRDDDLVSPLDLLPNLPRQLTLDYLS